MITHTTMPGFSCGYWGFELRASSLQSKSYPLNHLPRTLHLPDSETSWPVVFPVPLAFSESIIHFSL